MKGSQLTARQMKFARLVADGMPDNEAVVEAGYCKTNYSKILSRLRDHAAINRLIEDYRNNKGNPKNGAIATKRDREILWTEMMNDPSFSPAARLEASKLLGKAQGDFTTKKEIEQTIISKPVVVVPNSSPEEWEEYWEKSNDK